ncbi:MAG TPA: hypothetical protein PLQ64_14755, partial [Thiobacillaceae bacterium]|nr:hypothetical protein [Thiobacillaceae bacterium]
MAIPAWKSLVGTFALLFGLGLAPGVEATAPASSHELPAATSDAKPEIANFRCLRCHADPEEKVKVRKDGSKNFIYIDPKIFEHSVHGKQPCTGCHNNVEKLPHPKPLPKSVGCIECHKKKFEAQKDSKDPEYKRLGVVVQQMESYLHSIHAQPNKKDISKINATC